MKIGLGQHYLKKLYLVITIWLIIFKTYKTTYIRFLNLIYLRSWSFQVKYLSIILKSLLRKDYVFHTHFMSGNNTYKALLYCGTIILYVLTVFLRKMS